VQLDTEFVRLPLRFDAQRLAEEVGAVPDEEWVPHPQGEKGNDALLLVSRNGDSRDDATKGVMRPTKHLLAMPYLRQVLGSFQTVIGRTRLMRIEAEGVMNRHCDTSHYWRERVRIHVPITTTPDVRFHCGKKSVHMGLGEAWVFDTWRPHGVENPASSKRVHLVSDSVGSPALWQLIAAGQRADGATAADRIVPFDPDVDPKLEFESVNLPVVMSPWEVDATTRWLMSDMREMHPDRGDDLDTIEAELEHLRRAWRAQWAKSGDAAAGWDSFEEIRLRADQRLARFEKQLPLRNNVDGIEAVRQLVLRAGLNRDLGQRSRTRRRSRLDRPVFVVSSPRSGSSMLFEALAKSPTAWTIGGESHRIIESIAPLTPAANGWESNRLDASHVTQQVVQRLSQGFVAELRDRDGEKPKDQGPYRLVEKTPKNALRIPFLAKAFPDALFVYLYRDPRETISSMLDAWRSGRFVTYPKLPGWAGPPWSLLLTPGWRSLPADDLSQVVASQWATTTSTLLDDLGELDADRWCVTSYDKILADPNAELSRLCEFLDLEWDQQDDGPLPLSSHTLTSPEPEKWRRNAAELEAIWPVVKDVANRAHSTFANPPATQPQRPARASVGGRGNGRRQQLEQAFSSVHTDALPPLLEKAASSLVVTTYQSGRVILVRSREGVLNTHFRFFPMPMGVAARGNALVLGTRRSVWEFRDQPAVAAKLPPEGSHDACFVPRGSHVTGDIRIHELVYTDDALWAVNTRFSCLSTLDPGSSFVPQWRPSFISALAAEDRCHLNGVAVRDGKVRYVTALSKSDEAGGWRAFRGSGGLVIDIESGEEIITGLSMPHSPRWHNGKLWVLESGRGEVVTVDINTGARETVAQLPGFTRGLAFVGRYAFVGLSQVRETVFGGTPLVERLDPSERRCGVWVIDTETGNVVAFLRFEGVVREIFDVQLLPGIRYPELVEPEAELVDGSFVLPQEAMAQVASRN
jgi:uncharacterized protein (TIGR03032 family)